jgi:hypothetical protein
METLDKSTAKKLFIEAKKFQEMLEKIFGKKNLTEFDYHNIKSYEDALEVEDPIEEDKLLSTDSYGLQCLKKIQHIVRIVNGPDFVPNILDTKQKKWAPWFKVLPSGLGFAASIYFCDCPGTVVGARLCYESKEKSDFTASQPEILKLYQGYILNKAI